VAQVNKDMIVRWAPITVDQAFPLAKQKEVDMYSTQLATEQLKGWIAKAKGGGGKTYSWVYYFNEIDFLMPQPNWFNMVPDIELLAQSGIRGIFAEGEGSYPVAEMCVHNRSMCVCCAPCAPTSSTPAAHHMACWAGTK
jgi:hypothetical protein